MPLQSVTGAVSRYLPISKARRKKKRESPEYRGHSETFGFAGKVEEDADSIQLWCGDTKTEYPSPSDNGDLSSGSQLPDRDLCTGLGRTEEDSGDKKRFNTAEHMVHITKKNTARFDFDLRFPKMPSYLRRSRSSMRLEVYLRMRPGWGSGKDRSAVRKAEIYLQEPCHAGLLPGCDVPRRRQKEKMKHI